MMKVAAPKVAVVGVGYWGPKIVRNLMRIDPEGVSWVCDIDQGNLANIAKRYSGLKTTTSLDDILNDPETDGVMLALPPREHHFAAMRVLEAGKHLFVEKPVSLELKQIQQITDKARESGLILMVGFVYRYNSMIDKIGRLIEQGNLGKIQRLYSWRTNTNLRPKNANIIWALLPHDISILRHWLGALPDTVRGESRCINNANCAITMTFPENVRANVFLSWNEPVKTRRICVIGKRGILLYDEINSPAVLQVFPNEIPDDRWNDSAPLIDDIIGEIGVQGEKISVEMPLNEPLNNECRHFLDCIRTGSEPLTNGRDAVVAAKIILDVLDGLPKK